MTAFVEGKLEAPKHLARTVHDLYFEPKYEEFKSRTTWSLSNALTSALKELDPIPHSKPLRSSASFWRRGSHSRSSLRRYRPGRHSLIALFCRRHFTEVGTLALLLSSNSAFMISLWMTDYSSAESPLTATCAILLLNCVPWL